MGPEGLEAIKPRPRPAVGARRVSFVRARAPLRLSFAGGGTDVPPYCDDHGGLVLNATINKFVHSTLRPLAEPVLRFRSHDLGHVAEYGAGDALYPDGKVDLLTAVARHFPGDGNGGFELSVRTDAPPGSGVGASSAVVVSAISAFKEWLSQPLSPYEVAELAIQIERKELGIKGGKQDQYAAAFGGFNFIEFHRDATVVHPLRLDGSIVNELEERLVLCHVGRTQLGVGIIDDQVRRYKAGEGEAVEATHQLKKACLEMKRALLMGDVDEVGQILSQSYQNKKKMSDRIATATTEKIYEKALASGALGGKISGAGGGGFMFFIARHDRYLELSKALHELGFPPIPVSFEGRGGHAWRVNDLSRVTWNA